jgi:hypothetical protein
MTQLHRIALAGAIMLTLAHAANAQSNPPQTQITINYHEVIPPGSDSTPVFLSIFDRLRHDCELVGKAFSRQCVITQININVNANYGDMAGTRNLNANATIILPPGSPNGLGSTPPGSPAPAR